MRYLLILLSFITSCSSNKIPKDVLPPEKMSAVWYDIVLADELTDFASITDSTYRLFSKRAGLYDTVLQIHKINKQQYKKSEQFYQGRPDLMKEIFEDLKKKMDTPIKKSIKPA
jgi:hypothetical protein